MTDMQFRTIFCSFTGKYCSGGLIACVAYPAANLGMWEAFNVEIHNIYKETQWSEISHRTHIRCLNLMVNKQKYTCNLMNKENKHRAMNKYSLWFNERNFEDEIKNMLEAKKCIRNFLCSHFSVSYELSGVLGTSQKEYYLKIDPILCNTVLTWQNLRVLK